MNHLMMIHMRFVKKVLTEPASFFVPFGQDDPVKKPTSLVADFRQIPETVAAALEGRQIQPILYH